MSILSSFVVSLIAFALQQSAVEPPLQNSACVPLQVPAGYSAPDVEPVVDLSGPWDMVPSKRQHAPAPRNLVDHPARTTFHAPGRTILARTDAKYRVVWLEKRFTLDRNISKKHLALSLGGRIGRTVVWLNGKQLNATQPPSNAPLFFGPSSKLPWIAGENTIRLKVTVHRNVDGLRWYQSPAIGPPIERTHGLIEHTYTRDADEGNPVTFSLFVPPCVDPKRPLPLVVALPGWGGNLYSFADNALVDAASSKTEPFLIVTPPTGGNVLYTDTSEENVLDVVRRVIADIPGVDAQRIHIMGLSMGGAGALQIGYHYPGIFASIASYYGDSEYNLSTTKYIRPILRTPERARRYSVLNFVHNAGNTPVLLVHAKDDPVSPFRESARLFRASKRAGYTHHTFRAFETGGHSLDLLDRTTPELVRRVHTTRLKRAPKYIEFKTDSPRYTRSFWLENEVERRGVFASIRASWENKEQHLTVHTWESSSKRLTILSEHLNMRDQWKVTLSKDMTEKQVFSVMHLHRPHTLWSIHSEDRTAPPIHWVLNAHGAYEIRGLRKGTYIVSAKTR